MFLFITYMLCYNRRRFPLSDNLAVSRLFGRQQRIAAVFANLR